jgi:hypothetical protein
LHYCLSFNDSIFLSIALSGESIPSAALSGDAENLEMIANFPELLLFLNQISDDERVVHIVSLIGRFVSFQQWAEMFSNPGNDYCSTVPLASSTAY